MKKISFIIIGLVAIVQFVSCTEQEMPVFGDRHEVYFKKFFINEAYPGTGEADSTLVSFFFAPDDEKYIDANLIVYLAGRKLEEDLHFSLRVVPEETTALPSEYELDKFYTFGVNSIHPGAKDIIDTIGVKMCRSERLKDMPNGVKLVLEIVPQGNVFPGQFERSRAHIVLVDSAVRPTWWTKEVEYYLMGTYSPKKYKVLLANIEEAATISEVMIENRPDEAIKIARAFKKWLSEQDTSNPDIYEEDGSLMTVSV